MCLSSEWVNCVVFKPDNPNIVVSGSDDKTIKTWDITSGSCLSILRGHTDIVGSVCFSSDGKQLTSGSGDTTVRNWDPTTRASLS